MAPKVTVDGKIDDKPLPQDLKARIETSLKSSIEKELKVGGIVPSRHFSITHFSIVFAEA
jgi:hypothetical protein